MKLVLPICLLSLVVASFVSCVRQSSPQPTAHELVLQPDSTTAQDSYVAIIDNDPSDGNTNLNFAHELCLGRWTLS